MDTFTVEQLKELFPCTLDTMLIITEENIETIDLEKEFEEFSNESLEELEEILESITDYTKEQCEKEFDITFNEHQLYRIGNKQTPFEVLFSRDEHILKVCEKYEQLNELVEILEDYSFMD